MLIAQSGGLVADDPRLHEKIKVVCNVPVPDRFAVKCSDSIQEQNIAHASQQKKFRRGDVQINFERAVESKGWLLLRETYIPQLSVALSELRTQATLMQTVVRETAPYFQSVSDSQHLNKSSKAFRIHWADGVQPAQVCVVMINQATTCQQEHIILIY